MNSPFTYEKTDTGWLIKKYGGTSFIIQPGLGETHIQEIVHLLNVGYRVVEALADE